MWPKPVPMISRRAEAKVASTVGQGIVVAGRRVARRSGQEVNVLMQRMTSQVDLAAPGAAHNRQASRSAGAS